MVTCMGKLNRHKPNRQSEGSMVRRNARHHSDKRKTCQHSPRDNLGLLTLRGHRHSIALDHPMRRRPSNLKLDQGKNSNDTTDTLRIYFWRLHLTPVLLILDASATCGHCMDHCSPSSISSPDPAASILQWLHRLLETSQVEGIWPVTQTPQSTKVFGCDMTPP
jgi:hypothetical protein